MVLAAIAGDSTLHSLKPERQAAPLITSLNALLHKQIGVQLPRYHDCWDKPTMNLSGPAGLLILPGSVLIYCLCRDYSPTVNLLTVFLHMDETAKHVRLA